MIADNYLPEQRFPKVFPQEQFLRIPRFSVRVQCSALQDVNTKIFSEWLPNCKDYEIAAGYSVEMYTPADDYKNGMVIETITVKSGFRLKRSLSS